MTPEARNFLAGNGYTKREIDSVKDAIIILAESGTEATLANAAKVLSNGLEETSRISYSPDTTAFFRKLGAKIFTNIQAGHGDYKLLESLSKKQRFKLIAAIELVTKDDPLWVVDEVLQAATNSVLAATRASFKSFLALWIAACVALGRDWCGRKVMQGVVIYICAEGAAGMKKRLQALCFDLGVEPPAELYFIDEAVQFSDNKEREALIELLSTLKVVLIVADTMSLCALDRDENSTKDMNPFMADVKKIQDATGAHVMLIHHESKAGGTRGSSAVPAATQTEMLLKREGNSARLSCLKQKDSAEFKDMIFTAREVEYDTWKRKSSLVLDYNGDDNDNDAMGGTAQIVFDLLVNHFGQEGATTSQWLEVATEHKISNATFYRAKTLLMNCARVRADKEGRGAKYRPATQ